MDYFTTWNLNKSHLRGDFTYTGEATYQNRLSPF